MENKEEKAPAFVTDEELNKRLPNIKNITIHFDNGESVDINPHEPWNFKIYSPKALDGYYSSLFRDHKEASPPKTDGQS
jgi:hypothetical protein